MAQKQKYYGNNVQRRLITKELEGYIDKLKKTSAKNTQNVAISRKQRPQDQILNKSSKDEKSSLSNRRTRQKSVRK